MSITIVPNTKIRIKSPEHSKYVQELAFASGFFWERLEGQNEPLKLDANCLYFNEDYNITWGFLYLFEKSKAQEIFIDLPPSEGQTFSCARAGNRVFHLQEGWGTVDEVDFDDPDLQIGVIFDGQKVADWYRVDGRVEASDKLPSLYWGEVEIIPPPKPVRMKLVLGVEIPDISFTPNDGEKYVYPNIYEENYATASKFYKGYTTSEMALKAGCCYPPTAEGTQAAILHAKAMLGINPYGGARNE